MKAATKFTQLLVLKQLFSYMHLSNSSLALLQFILTYLIAQTTFTNKKKTTGIGRYFSSLYATVEEIETVRVRKYFHTSDFAL